MAECKVTFTRFKSIKVNNRAKQRLLCIGISVVGHLNMVLLGYSDVGGMCLAGLMQQKTCLVVDTYCMMNSVIGHFNLVGGTFSDGKPKERG